ncbi:MAG: hypothetical protein IIC90_13945 [Chloroflexi bacterium]|nr:hypothetical protein [Chloroflexota bacterium]
MPNLHEFDAIIIDLGTLENRSEATEERVTRQLTEMMNGGGLIVCFPPKTRRLALGWLPGNFQPREVNAGRRIKLLEHPLLKDLLERFAGEMRYDLDFAHPAANTWTPIASTMAGWPIAGVAESNHVIMLPRVRRPERLVADLFRQVVPQIMPDRITVKEPLTEEPPPWVGEFPVPGTEELEQEIDAIDQKLSTLEEKRQRKAEELERLADFQGLLWYKGKHHLEPVVQHALELLGVPCQNEEPRDLVYRGKGGPLYIEIEGSNGSIDVDKGRQLLGYIADSEDDPSTIKGAIIGNPFRQHHPKDRPLNNRPPFSPQLQRLAEKQGWPLVKTVDLFDLVSRHLCADKRAAPALRTRLGLPSRSR